MAEFTDVMKQQKRMCKSFKENNCKGCPLGPQGNKCGALCFMFVVDHYQEAEEIIMKWAEEHPIKTNADKFREVFGMNILKGLKKCNGFECAEGVNCDSCKYKGFWDKEYEEKQ